MTEAARHLNFTSIDERLWRLIQQIAGDYMRHTYNMEYFLGEITDSSRRNLYDYILPEVLRHVQEELARRGHVLDDRSLYVMVVEPGEVIQLFPDGQRRRPPRG